MSITTEQLEHAIWCAREACDKNYGGADVYFAIAEKTVDALEAELHRRKHGPFTRSEAIASGRAFRRKGSGPWANAMLLSEDEVACDYELAPEAK